MKKTLLVNASPHLKGSTDRAFNLVLEKWEKAEYIVLRDRKIIPCIGCQTCAKAESRGRCIFEDKDEVKAIFDSLAQREKLVFFSPIYFYHLPSLFKGFIDRAQSFYMLNPAFLPVKKAKAVLLAGRPKGEKLFEGARLTLKYFLQIFGYEVEVLGLRGVDGPEDLDAHKEQEILDFVQSW
ncbi:MAG TPA: hypothetical protein DIT19_03805 [Desulfonauticus sp.]|nr:MAG: NADPH-dependent FMN reductase [Desulfonauticus sp. 38_4375]HCO12333.1 hypothetical protein [Desulfonauticus sp.]